MTKRLFSGLLFMALLLAAVPAAFAQTPYYFWLQARDELGRPITSGVSCQVYTAGGDTASTIYTSRLLTTAASNPLTGDSRGQCSWWMSASDAVDVIVWTKRGRARFDSFSVNDHSVIVGQQASVKAVRVPFSRSATKYTNTGVTIPKGAVLRDVLIEVTSVGSGSNGKHIAIGISPAETGGVANGFCAQGVNRVGDTLTGGRELNSLGWKACHAVLATSPFASASKGNQDAMVGAFHSGTLISRGAIGSTTQATAHAGSYFRYPFIGNGVAKTVIYATSPHDVAGNFYLIFDELGND